MPYTTLLSRLHLALLFLLDRCWSRRPLLEDAFYFAGASLPHSPNTRLWIVLRLVLWLVLRLPLELNFLFFGWAVSLLPRVKK